MIDPVRQYSLQSSRFTECTKIRSLCTKKQKNMDENHDLSNVIEVVTQASLENQIENDAEALMTKKSLDQEQQRLERSQNKLNLLRDRKKGLEKRLRNATRISVKQKLKTELADLQKTDFEPLLKDIKEIHSRILELQTQSKTESNTTGKQKNETEKEYLIRTGQITAFGNKSDFHMESNDQGLNDDVEVINSDISEFENDISQNEEKVPYSDASDYEEEEPDIKKNKGIKSTDAIDDGDELYYQHRLHKWIKARSVNRKFDANPHDPEWFKSHPNFKDASLNGGFKIPGEIFSQLFNYQKTAVQWLWELHQQNCGGILGDEMGLGKTIQIIAFLASLHHSKKLDKPVLIVCPATLMKQWVSELHLWWPAFRSVILHSIGSGFDKNKYQMGEEELEDLLINSENFSYKDYADESNLKEMFSNSKAISNLIDKVLSDGHIVITTYVGLKIYSKVLLDIDWGYVVLDEGHKIRNPNADISLTAKKLRSKHRLILSGTPIQNNLNELWSIFDFIFPGKLGTLPVFQQQFAIPISVGGYANATNLQVQTGYKCAVVLRDLISPYFLRRVKTDVAKDLPKKNELVLFCKLTRYQRDKYLEFLNSDEMAKIKRGKMQVLYGIDVLRKICNHPDLLIGKNFEEMRPRDYGNPLRSGKLQVVKQLLLKWKSEGHKTLLFTQTKQMLDIIESFISTNDEEMAGIVSWLRMDGSTRISVRQKLVDQFNNGPTDVFLLTTRVGGLGVNLVGANRIIIFDPDWNPSTDLQARERAWRIGQTREVTIYRLMVSGSIEEKIYHRQIFKQFLTNKILKDPNQKRFFKMNELHDLFTLGSERGHSEELDKSISEITEREKKNIDDDFHDVAGVTKLEGFYNSKEETEKKKDDDQRMMDGLFGVESVIDHDNVVNSHSKPGDDIIKREAARAAERAVSALKQSRQETKRYKVGTPTWTGKFGVAGKGNKVVKNVRSSSPMGGSSSILNKIKKLAPKSANKSSEALSDVLDPSGEIIGASDRTLKQELEKIQDYLRESPGQFATSTDIISMLGVDLKQRHDILRVRALLKKVSVFDKTKKGWVLNKDVVPTNQPNGSDETNENENYSDSE